MADVATGTGRQAVEPALEEHRRELTGYCYRMLGSASDAEDAVQETMVRAWRKADRFEGRSSVRTWLYSIATNVCLDLINGKQRRALPMDLGPSSPADVSLLGPQTSEEMWVLPAPDGRVLSTDDDPAERAVASESIRLAFVAALQHLPARQRAVLVLREVLRWKADEVAELLDSTVASVNSALQRARATLDSADITPTERWEPSDPAQQEFLARYVDAFERYDMDSLLALLDEDVKQDMPPYELWLEGRESIREWYLGPGAACQGSRLVPTRANGSPAFGQYRPSGPGGAHEPWALQVLELAEGRIVEMHFFLDTATLFPLFGLPAHPDG